MFEIAELYGKPVETNLRLPKLLLVLTVLLLSAPALAQSVTVTVFKDGKALDGAVVCLGSKQEKSLYGRYETDDKGKVKINDLPNGKLFVTTNDQSAGATIFFRFYNSQQDLFLHIPNESNSIRCQDDSKL